MLAGDVVTEDIVRACNDTPVELRHDIAAARVSLPSPSRNPAFSEHGGLFDSDLAQQLGLSPGRPGPDCTLHACWPANTRIPGARPESAAHVSAGPAH